MLRRLLGIFSLLTTIPNAAFGAAAFYTAGQVLDRCSTSDRQFDQSECYGYILGLADMYAVTTGKRVICMPEDVTAAQVRDAVLTFIENNPNQKVFLAQGVVAAALYETFPCSGN